MSTQVAAKAAKKSATTNGIAAFVPDPHKAPGKIIGESRTVPLSAVIFDDEIPNIRTRYENMNALIDSLKMQGQQDPVTVWERKPGVYSCIRGFRRVTGLRVIAKDKGIKPEEMPVRVTVRAYESIADALIANADDIGTREAIRLYDQVARFAALVKLGVKPEAASKAVGVSASHGRNLILFSKEIVPEVLTAWRDSTVPHGGNANVWRANDLQMRTSGDLSFKEASAMAKLSPKDQRAMLKSWSDAAAGVMPPEPETTEEGDEGGGGGGEGEDKGGGGGLTAPGKKDIKERLLMLETKAAKDAKDADSAIRAQELRWVLTGKKSSKPMLYEAPKAETK